MALSQIIKDESKQQKIKQIIAYFIHDNDIHLRNAGKEVVLVSKFSEEIAKKIVEAGL